jgi:hypothetical protein
MLRGAANPENSSPSAARITSPSCVANLTCLALRGGGGLLLAAKVKRARGQQPKMATVGILVPGNTSPEARR